MLDRIIRGVLGKKNGSDAPDAVPDDPFSMVMSVPPDHRNDFIPRLPNLLLTYDVLADLFRAADRELRIFSPYIDATFTSLAMMTKAPIKVLTTIHGKGRKAVGVIERCAMSRNVEVRYIHHTKNDSHLYQLHAKMVLADDKLGYVGSANLTDASIHYNFELGFLVRDRKLLRSLTTTS